MPLLLSRALLIIEALPCAYLTLLGFMMVAGSLIPPMVGAEFVAADVAVGIVVLVLLVVAWTLFFVFMFKGHRSARSLNKIWWWLAGAGAAVCGFSALVAHFSERDWVNMQSFSLLIPGAWFVVPFAHLSAEVWLRKR